MDAIYLYWKHIEKENRSGKKNNKQTEFASLRKFGWLDLKELLLSFLLSLPLELIWPSSLPLVVRPLLTLGRRDAMKPGE